MRTRVFLMVVIAVLLVPAAAHAKGPVAATIDGVGLGNPISVDGHDDSTISTLRDQSGFMPAAFKETPDPMMRTAPTGGLGPKLVVTWRVPNGLPADDFVRQDMYPYAAGGPLVYTEPGQPFLQTEHTYGGWYWAPAALTTSLSALGVPDRATLEAAGRPAPAAPSGSWVVAPLLFAAGAVAVGTAVLTTVGVAARRRRRVAPA